MTYGAIANAALISIGVLIHPVSVAGRNGLISLIGPALILFAYFAIGRRASRTARPEAEQPFQMGAIFGLASGCVFASEISLEYTIRPGIATNIQLGRWEYGTVFFLFAVAAFWSSYRSGQIRTGIGAATWSAMLGSTIWLAVLLSLTYAFWDTPAQQEVFRAEGDYEDFARSGMADFSAFTMQDLRGAAFFHLLLSPILATAVGLPASVIGKAFRKL